MSAEPPHRDSTRPRPSSTFAFMSYLFGPPYRPPPQPASDASATPHHPPGVSSEPQPPLPPLRALNRVGLPFGIPSGSGSQLSDDELPFGFRVHRSRPSSSSSRNPARSTLDEIGLNLDDANSHLRALLDLSSPHDLLTLLPTHDDALPSPPLPSARTMPPVPRGASTRGRRAASSSRPDESGSSSRMAKRRKLNANRARFPPFRGFRYGRFGQVEPGFLTLEIVSCDGGLFSDGTSAYAAENILKRDTSVYCTKGNRCNIVLQHEGSAAFSLKELVIRAPRKHYSSPVRRGMVFLSMSKDELLRSRHYQSDVPPPPAATSLFRHAEAFRRRAAEQAQFEALVPIRDSDNDNDNDNGNNDGELGDDAPYEDIHDLTLDASDPTPAAAGADLDRVVINPHAFRVTTECIEEDENAMNNRGPHGEYLPALIGWEPRPLPRVRSTYRPRGRGRGRSSFAARRLRWVEDHNGNNNDDDDDEDGDNNDDSDNNNENQNDADDSPALFDLGDASGEAATAPSASRPSLFEGRGSGQAEPEPEPPVAPPHAEFHIEKNNNKCTIRFDPPVTARYILLKMWNPKEETGNIDIQGVVARGYAGTRFFPAVDLR